MRPESINKATQHGAGPIERDKRRRFLEGELAQRGIRHIDHRIDADGDFSPDIAEDGQHAEHEEGIPGELAALSVKTRCPGFDIPDIGHLHQAGHQEQTRDKEQQYQVEQAQPPALLLGGLLIETAEQQGRRQGCHYCTQRVDGGGQTQPTRHRLGTSEAREIRVGHHLHGRHGQRDAEHSGT
ncbi:hypothetical protein D3C71_1278840 [compost metagenome]